MIIFGSVLGEFLEGSRWSIRRKSDFKANRYPYPPTVGEMIMVHVMFSALSDLLFVYFWMLSHYVHATKSELLAVERVFQVGR